MAASVIDEVPALSKDQIVAKKRQLHIGLVVFEEKPLVLGNLVLKELAGNEVQVTHTLSKQGRLDYRRPMAKFEV